MSSSLKIFFCGLIFLVSAPSFAQRILSGRVQDKKGEAIPLALVSIDTLKLTTSTNMDGQFSLSAPERSSYLISVSAEGFTTLQVNITA